MAEFFAKEIILGLTVQEFLLHLLNFVILVVCLYLLLYKPVKKFIKKRSEEYKAAEEKYRNSLKFTEESSRKAEEMLDKAREEAVKIAEEAHALAMVQTQEIIAGAHEEAEEIIKKTILESQNAQKTERENFYYSLSGLAVDISEKLVGREFNVADNEEYVNSIVNVINKEKENYFRNISEDGVENFGADISKQYKSSDNDIFIDKLLESLRKRSKEENNA